jgi:signal peptidase II
MIESRMTRKVFDVLMIILFVVALDQVTKYLANAYLQPRGSLAILGDFLRLTYVENPGMAFGIEIDNKILFNILSIIAVFVIFYYLFKLRSHSLLRISFAVILGGAVGNLMDRFMRGRVVDFLDVEFFDIHFPGGSFLFLDIPAYSLYRWPVFNIADIAVSTGMLIILFTTFFNNPPVDTLENAAREEA